MSSVNDPFLIAAIAFIAIFLYFVSSKLKEDANFDPETITLDEDWVMDAFHNEAAYLIENHYDINGMPMYANNENQAAAYIIQTCCEGNRLSRDFCDYIRTNYPDIRRSDLWDAIADYREFRETEIQNNMNEFLDGVDNITPKEFFEIKQRQKGDIVGVYILHNETNGQYYVGQAKKMFFRINQHFTGHGNGDVYADYKYGNDFSIKIIKLSKSGYDDIDQLEMDMIKKYHANITGYNRTAGNHS